MICPATKAEIAAYASKHEPTSIHSKELVFIGETDEAGQKHWVWSYEISGMRKYVVVFESKFLFVFKSYAIKMHTPVEELVSA